jgi:hypothetical protein
VSGGADLSPLAWKVSEQGLRIGQTVLTAALVAEIGPAAAALIAKVVTQDVLEELLAKVSDAPGVEVSAGVVTIEED